MGIGFVGGVGSVEGWEGCVVGVGLIGGIGLGLFLVWGELGRPEAGGREVSTSISVPVGVMRYVGSFLGVV